MKYLILLFVFFLTETVFTSSYEDYMESLEDLIEDTTNECEALVGVHQHLISAATSEFNSSKLGSIESVENIESIDNIEEITAALDYIVDDMAEVILHAVEHILEGFSENMRSFSFPITPYPRPASFSTSSLARRDVEQAFYPGRRDRRVNQVLGQKKSIFKEIHYGLYSCTNYQFTFPAISIEDESEKLRWQKLVKRLKEDAETELRGIRGAFWGKVSDKINAQPWVERESYIFGLINTEEEVPTFVRPPCSAFPRTDDVSCAFY